jgi:hypothetical protein
MTLTLATLTILLAPAVVIIALHLLVRRQIANLRRRPSFPPDWTPDLSVDRYRPMFRLLANDDLCFLRSQPGATPALVARLRRQRYQVFLGYLRSLQRDFHQACEALVLVAVQSQTDRQDILRALIFTRMKFTIGCLRVRCLLLLYRWNVGQEPVANLVNLFERLQLELLAFAEPTATPQLS